MRFHCKRKKCPYKKAVPEVVTGSNPHACGTSQSIYGYFCAQVNLVGRAQDLRFVSVATFWKLLPSPYTNHLGIVLGPPLHW